MRATLVLLLVAASALLALPASAKEGVRAKLDEPVKLGRAPGRTVEVAWHLVDADGRRFGASEIYLRVLRCGRRPFRVAVTETSPRSYSARFKVCRGGIRRLQVGLRGWRIVAGRTERADRIFRFDPPLARRC